MNSLQLDTLAIKKTAPGHECLSLSERISWEDFGGVDIFTGTLGNKFPLLNPAFNEFGDGIKILIQLKFARRNK
jgi:hypothetical protein